MQQLLYGNFAPKKQSEGSFLFLTLGTITCLILLINVSFKIITIHGLIFAVNSLLCPIISIFYLCALRTCTFKQQRHLLNCSVMTLYLFCIGVYVLVNLPAAPYMNDNPVYQIVFEDIPKKFFATTIAFALSFYLPHLLFCTPAAPVLNSPRHCVLLALLGGISFFLMDFFLLFSGPHVPNIRSFFIDSLMISCLLLVVMGTLYLSYVLVSQREREPIRMSSMALPIYDYLICFSAAVMLMCLVCEYRIVSLGEQHVITASSIFFPITLMISTLIGEHWGYKANLKLTAILIIIQCVFDGLLMGLVALPSPSFFNLNPFYSYIMPRRVPAASLAIFVTFITNAMLLHYLKKLPWDMYRSLRIFIANSVANSLLCLVNYSLLFGGIYSYDQIIHLVINAWEYKLLATLLGLPVILWLCQWLQKTNETMKILSVQ